MIAGGIKVLSDSDRERIHEAALDVLAKGGVVVDEKELREQLKARGATEGATANQIRIPRELIAECLESVNRTPVLHCVNGKALQVRPQDRYYCSLVTDPYIIDYRQGIRRPRLDDIARHARLSDALTLVDVVHLMDDTIPGLETAVSELKCLEAFVANTTTAYHCAPGTLEGTRRWIEVARIMAGGDLRTNPILAAYVPSVSPLALTALNIRQLRLFLESGVLCFVGPCPIAGATAPWPVAGLVAQSWAKFLAMVAAVQVIRSGAPVGMHGGGVQHMDMRNMESMHSGVCRALATAAISELLGWLQLPAWTGHLTSLCSNYGVQNGMESALGAFATFFARANFYGSLGSLANACGMSAVQIVLHHDLLEMLERFQRGIDVTDDKLAVESILSVGPRGNFLTDRLTLKYLRSDEHFYAPCFEQCAPARDKQTMAERAHERAEDLIASHEPAVPQDRLDDVRRYVERELKKLGRAA